MSPVLLFNMSLIVLFVGTAPPEIDGPRSLQKVAPEMPGQELRAIVHLEGAQTKGSICSTCSTRSKTSAALYSIEQKP